MCCRNDIELIETLFLDTNEIIAYKVLILDGKSLLSPIYFANWSPGWIISDSPVSKYLDQFEVFEGIHVFLNLKDAYITVQALVDKFEDLKSSLIPKIVPVVCNKIDLLGAGETIVTTWWINNKIAKNSIKVNVKNGKSAVFYKVFLKQEDYDKCLAS